MIAILGGTFDPPHLGHEFLAKELLERFNFKELWIIPTGQPYLNKTTSTAGSVRLELARAAFEGLDPRISVRDIEVKRAASTQMRTTTWETLQELRSAGSPLTMCVGSDQWNQIDSWDHFPAVLKLCHWVVFEREGHPFSGQNHYGLRLGTELIFYKTESPEISSSQVRQDIEKTGKINEKMTSQRVKDCLMKHHLYGTKI
ncbi:MAG: nicotinate (nicotinamide) nucleotide adenylyltransferase [Xanthomonadaceae bacterium]|nr:nicotinate (nicotinamide) nucleotide adenylyltransferase [Xanthomonadaceae bacterium]